jgi:hypothetical protein
MDDSVLDNDGPQSPTLEVVDKLRKEDAEHAPETADRILRAKYTFMSKQLAAATDLRKKMEEQSRDQQRQLQTEREEKKNLQKRYTSNICLSLLNRRCIAFLYSRARAIYFMKHTFLTPCSAAHTCLLPQSFVLQDVSNGGGAAQKQQAHPRRRGPAHPQ